MASNVLICSGTFATQNVWGANTIICNGSISTVSKDDFQSLQIEQINTLFEQYFEIDAEAFDVMMTYYLMSFIAGVTLGLIVRLLKRS